MTKTKILTIGEYGLLFLLGALLYPVLEIVFRGFSHWSMALAGGICLAVIHLIDNNLKSRSLLLRCLISAIFITETEFLIGCAVNIIGGMNVWDYSHIPYNILGQICPRFTFIWFLISFPAFLISRGASRIKKRIAKRTADP